MGAFVSVEHGDEMLLCRWWLEQSPGQIAVAVHGPAHDYLPGGFLVEQEVLLEWTEHHEKSPVTKPRMFESAGRTNLRVLLNKMASGLHDVEITISHVPSGIDRIPFVMALDVRDKIIGLAQAHAPEAFARPRTRSRIA